MAATMPPIRSMRSMYARASASIRFVSASTKYEPPSGSTTSTTPVSWAMICCVRRASVAASVVGSASASSSELVCSELVPPSTPASACSVVRTTLLYGCCAVSEHAGGLRVEAQLPASARIARRTGRASPAPRCGAPRGYFAISSKKSLCALKKNEMRGTNVVHVEPGVDAPLHVLDAVAQRERQLLQPPSSPPRGCGTR